MNAIANDPATIFLPFDLRHLGRWALRAKKLTFSVGF